jgi:hypothetical protein
VLPFNVARTWHLQLAIFWVATSFLAAGIFLVPMIVGREPKKQNVLAYSLLGALAIVVFGSLAGEYAGIKGWIQHGWVWFGNQGFEYLDLGRFWQILLILGLFFWAILLFRGLRGRLSTSLVRQIVHAVKTRVHGMAARLCFLGLAITRAAEVPEPFAIATTIRHSHTTTAHNNIAIYLGTDIRCDEGSAWPNRLQAQEAGKAHEVPRSLARRITFTVPATNTPGPMGSTPEVPH